MEAIVIFVPSTISCSFCAHSLSVCDVNIQLALLSSFAWFPFACAACTLHITIESAGEAGSCWYSIEEFVLPRCASSLAALDCKLCAVQAGCDCMNSISAR